MKPVFFATPAAFRAWLKKNHARVNELLVGFYKKDSGRPSITWPESVDEALCFGWIDGIRRSRDDESYTIRFTPRTRTSTWSAVNIQRARELIRLGRMQPAGLKAFEARADERSATYSYEQRHSGTLAPADERRFRADKRAWEYFQSRPPGYRKAAIWWVLSAKREETRLKRLNTLIEDSHNERLIGLYQWSTGAKSKARKK
jgi:uncharacterized protein YdeI (YjbR/CyaY-like superfamily)